MQSGQIQTGNGLSANADPSTHRYKCRPFYSSSPHIVSNGKDKARDKNRGNWQWLAKSGNEGQVSSQVSGVRTA
ncbi:unnamed protein product [Nippostrongylus brasiliensis]|uniref:Uncharacterized protein n=1 Tax=Nippostrongylus brasiliensis TaxID=27835 RepID=A0A0N4XYW5_NIPBR|nr:unnamed protein product [Nippostrongylus brasiliensis]